MPERSTRQIAAVPVVLSAMTLNNYGGTCAYAYPAWVRSVADPETRVRPSGRSVQHYKEMHEFRAAAGGRKTGCATSPAG